MQGPKAPKDPAKEGTFFYIMRNKEIFAAKTPDGKGISFIYQDNGRLGNSAKIVGNIEDENIVKLLTTTKGFRELVKAIGVSVETNNDVDKCKFVYQMYGKTDPYGSGTSMEIILDTNGAEQIIELDKVNWSDDDNVPGQIRFDFGENETTANVSVRFYLNDGFTAPIQTLDDDVDFESDNYKKLVEKSLVQMGNTYRLKKAFDKAKSGEKMTVAFIGGSITQGAGATPINKKCYSYLTFEAIKNKYGDNIDFVKGGVGGTPSELGMIRFDRDILKDGEKEPDIIVVEFAVNDEGDETKGLCYESLVRKALQLPNKPAVVLIFSVFADDYNLQERLSPVGYRYDLPMVSLKNAVTDQFKLSKDAGRVISKSQYFYDIFHPTNLGHRVMADGLLNLFDKLEGTESKEDIDLNSIIPVFGKGFETVKLLDRKDNHVNAEIICGGFDGTDKELHYVEMDDELHGTPQFPYNWMKTTSSDDPFVMNIKCKSLLIVYKDSADIKVGRANVYVDGQLKMTIDPHIIGWTHCNPFIIINEAEAKMHEVKVSMVDEDKDKIFTILGFGYEE